MYDFVENEPIGRWDFLGLVSNVSPYFKVIVGNSPLTGGIYGGSDEWGQPIGCADGSSKISTFYAWSIVNLTSTRGTNDCNAVMVGGSLWDDSGKARNSGSIWVYAYRPKDCDKADVEEYRFIFQITGNVLIDST